MSSYRGPFADLAPSDQADIASWSEPEDACCDLCGEIIPQEDVSVEAYEVAGCLACPACIETLAEQGAHHERARAH